MKTNEYENQQNEWEALDFYLSPPTLIEILGHIKNNMIEAFGMAGDLSVEHKEMLLQAYHLVDNVQEYLFEN